MTSQDFGSILLLLTVLAFYCIPSIVAMLRHHPQIGPIITLNLLAGWTGLGWM